MKSLAKALAFVLVASPVYAHDIMDADLPTCKNSDQELCLDVLRLKVEYIKAKNMRDLKKLCKNKSDNLDACSWIVPETQTCRVIHGDNFPEWAKIHELNHCRGYKHTKCTSREACNKEEWVLINGLGDWYKKYHHSLETH